jgi:hypothetical protein
MPANVPCGVPALELTRSASHRLTAAARLADQLWWMKIEIIDVAAELDEVVQCTGTLVARYVEKEPIKAKRLEEVGNGREGALPVAFLDLDHGYRKPILDKPASASSTASSWLSTSILIKPTFEMSKESSGRVGTRCSSSYADSLAGASFSSSMDPSSLTPRGKVNVASQA